MNKIAILFYILVIVSQGVAALAAEQELDMENNGFIAGISQNHYNFENGAHLRGIGWQAGILQKTEQRKYGFLTGLLYFDYSKANGGYSPYSNVEYIHNRITFSLWLTQVFNKQGWISPAIGFGPAFIFNIKTSFETPDEVQSYNQVIFDLHAQLSLGAYIKLDKELYLYPQIIGGYNILNNTPLREDWQLEKEMSWGILVGIVYSVNYRRDY